MYYKIKRIKTVLLNVLVSFIGIFVKRDPNTVIIGAWNGLKFADNSRYIYQYLFFNKTGLGLNNVIWATREPALKQKLDHDGYKAVLCGTVQSRYWHLKAGLHVVCAAAFGLEDHKSDDIEVNLSWGAKKVQLWHGVGLKKTANASNAVSQQNEKQRNDKMTNLLSRGGWSSAYVLATSQKHALSQKAAFKLRDDQLFISCYPRNCRCLKYMEYEEQIIQKIKQAKLSILYVPTFRTDYSKYTHPLSLPKVKDFLKQNNYLWIEKPHSAEKHSAIYEIDDVNILKLDSDFDINIIYEFSSIVISDYSSAVFDAVYKSIPVIMYVPDLEIYESGDNGLWEDPRTYCKPILAFNGEEICQLTEKLANGSFFDKDTLDFYNRIKTDYYENRESEYEIIWNDIKNTLGGGQTR